MAQKDFLNALVSHILWLDEQDSLDGRKSPPQLTKFVLTGMSSDKEEPMAVRVA